MTSYMATNTGLLVQSDGDHFSSGLRKPWTHTHTHTQTHTHSYRQRYTHTHRYTHTDTHTVAHRDTHTHISSGTEKDRRSLSALTVCLTYTTLCLAVSEGHE